MRKWNLRNRDSLFLALGLLLVVSSCSFKPESPTEPGVSIKTEIQDREKLQSAFSKVEGLYKGTIETPSGVSVPVEVGFFQVLESVGKSPRGDTKMMPVLKARFRRLDMASRYSVSAAAYVQETSELTTSLFENGGPNSSASSSGLDLFSTQGTLSNGVYTAKVTTSSGFLGTLKVSFTSPHVDANPAGESNEYNQFLREQLEKIAGTYRGTISNGSITLQVEVKVDVLEVTRGNGSEPIHVVTIREQAGTSFGGLATGVYRPELKPPQITFANSTFNFAGEVEGGRIKGLVNLSGATGGFTGVMDVLKK